MNNSPEGYGTLAVRPTGRLLRLPKRIGLKSYMRLSGVLVKCVKLRYPTFQRIFGRAEESVGLNLRWDRRFTRSPDPTGAPSYLK